MGVGEFVDVSPLVMLEASRTDVVEGLAIERLSIPDLLVDCVVIPSFGFVELRNVCESNP